MIDIIPLLVTADWLTDQYITQNKSPLDIATTLGIGTTTVLNYLHSHNIEIKPPTHTSAVCTKWLNSIMLSDNVIVVPEYRIPGTRYTADGYCIETNTIYEFYGDYFHGNPEVYRPEVWNKKLDKSMGELHQNTTIKEHKIKELGYNLVVMWESDWNKL